MHDRTTGPRWRSSALDPDDFAEAPDGGGDDAARRCSPSSAARTSASPRWSTGSSGAGRPWCRTSPASPATASLRRAVERPPVHPRRHRRLGARRHRSAGRRRRAGRVRDAHRRRRAARRRRERRGHGHRRGRRPRAAPLRPCPSCSPPRRSTTSGSSPTRRRAVAPGPGGAAPGQRPARPSAPATCSTPSWRRCRRARATTSAPGAGGPRRVALVGKPNVGKSSLLNRVSGETRSVVHEVAGTTVDPVDSLVELDGEVWRFVDTAGLRKRVKTASGMEYYAQPAHPGRDRGRRGGGRARSTPASRSPSRTSA